METALFEASVLSVRSQAAYGSVALCFFQLFLLFLHVIDACLMTSAVKRFCHVCVYDTKCQGTSHNTGAHRKDIGIVMLAGHSRHIFIGAERTADARELVGNHRDTDTGAADHDTALCLTLKDILRNFLACQYIAVRNISGSRAALNHCVTHLTQVLYNDLTKSETRVI